MGGSQFLSDFKRKLKLSNRLRIAGHQWLIPVTLTTQEAERRMIMVRGQPRKGK
jgi:hypothetical protein